MIVVRPSEWEIEKRLAIDGEVFLTAFVDVIGDETHVTIKIIEPSESHKYKTASIHRAQPSL